MPNSNNSKGIFSNAEQAGRFLGACVDLSEKDGDLNEVAKKSVHVFKEYASFYGVNQAGDSYPISKDELTTILFRMLELNKWKFIGKEQNGVRELHPPMSRALGINRRKSLRELLQSASEEALTKDAKILLNVL